MSKEALGNLPTVPLETLAYQTKEQWEQSWQNLDFVKRFPKLAERFVSPKIKMELSEHDRKLMVKRSHTSFMTLPWKPGAPKAVAGISMFVDENLNPVPSTYRGTESRPQTDNLLQVNIGCLMLMGKSLEDKDYIDNLMSQRFSEFTHNKKANLRPHFSRLIRNSSLFAHWIKRHKLDAQNGFEWNRDVALLLLRVTKSKLKVIPSELTGDLKIYPLEVIDVFVDKGRTLIEGVSKSRIDAKDTTIQEFMMRLAELTRSGYFEESPLYPQVQQKIEDLRSAISTLKKTS